MASGSVKTVATALDDAIASLGSRAGVTMTGTRVAGNGRPAERRAGADAARRALDRAGGDGPIGREPDGRPRWPSGWTGSIAHAGGFCIAAVSPLTIHRAVGVDVECDGSLQVDDARLVLNPAELKSALAAHDPARAATLIWSAKESAFKAWSVASGGLHGVDPLDIHIEIHAETRRLGAVAGGALTTETFTRPLGGWYTIAAAMVLTLLTHPTTG